VIQVQPPEDAVPIGAIALALVQQSFRLFKTFLLRQSGAQPVQPVTGPQHTFLNVVRLLVFRKKTAPESAPHEPCTVLLERRGLPELLSCVHEFTLHAGGQCPSHHFVIGGAGNIGAAQGLVSVHVVAVRDRTQPGFVFRECLEKTLQPPLTVHALVRAGPYPEFFIIIVQHGTARPRFGCLFRQPGNGLMNLVKRDQVPETFQYRKDLH